MDQNKHCLNLHRKLTVKPGRVNITRHLCQQLLNLLRRHTQTSRQHSSTPTIQSNIDIFLSPRTNCFHTWIFRPGAMDRWIALNDIGKPDFLKVRFVVNGFPKKKKKKKDPPRAVVASLLRICQRSNAKPFTESSIHRKRIVASCVSK